jgi:hypothetical protein
VSRTGPAASGFAVDVPAVVLEPSPMAHLRDGARYERLASSLRGARWAVAIVPSRAARRSAVAELVVRLPEATPGTAVDELATLLAADVRKSLRRKGQDCGRIVIYGPSGELVRIVEVNETADRVPEPPSDRARAGS